MRLVETRSRRYGVKGLPLRVQNDLVHCPLLGTEPAVDRPGPGDIRRVIIHLGTGVDQKEVPVLQ